MANRLVELYKNEIAPSLKEQFKYSSVMQIPKLEKIVINMGVSDAKEDAKAMDHAVNDLTVISGQKPVVTKSRKSIANFRLREGQNVGCKVTLRGRRMYEFFDKLVSIALPRTLTFMVLIQIHLMVEQLFIWNQRAINLSRN